MCHGPERGVGCWSHKSKFRKNLQLGSFPIFDANNLRTSLGYGGCSPWNYVKPTSRANYWNKSNNFSSSLNVSQE